MIRITCFVRPHQLEEVKTAVANCEVTGMTVSDVRGKGNSPESSRMMAGRPILVALPPRAKLEVIAHDDQKDSIIEAICRAAETGQPGDGKIFVEPILDAIRIRTGESGQDGL